MKDIKAQILKAMNLGSGGAKPKHCPSGVDLLHLCSILGKCQKSQLCFMSEDLGSPGKIGRVRFESQSIKIASS